MEPGKWMLDSCLLDLASGELTNLTAIGRVSHYNGGLFYLPEGKGLGFTPLINGVSKPYLMDLDGRNKRDVSGRGAGFTYGYSASPDGKLISYHEDYQMSVFYTAQVGKAVELFQVTLDGNNERLTKTPDETLHYHPEPSPDGQWLAFGSKRAGVRQLYVMRLADRFERRITNLAPGHAAMWPHWQPAPSKAP
jgi:Tol biopolymer transport system component